jgi:hypothetical protein
MCWWLMPVILATQEAEVRRTSPKQIGLPFLRPYLEKTHHQKGWWIFPHMWTLDKGQRQQGDWTLVT